MFRVFILRINLQFPFILFRLGLSHGNFEIIEERVVVTILLEPIAEIVESEPPANVDDSQILEDSCGLFEFCFVELLLEQLSKVATESVDQFSLVVDKQSQIAMDHIFIFRNVQNAVYLNIVDLAWHFKLNNTTLTL